MSSWPRTCMRSSRLPDARLSAAWRAARTGVTTCRATMAAMKVSKITRIEPVVITAVRSTVRVATSWVRGKMK